MSRHIAHVFLYEFRRNFRRRGYLFTTFGIPLIAFIVYFVRNMRKLANSPQLTKIAHELSLIAFLLVNKTLTR